MHRIALHRYAQRRTASQRHRFRFTIKAGPLTTTTLYRAPELAPEVLEAAEKITLRDLLESPAYQAWLMSALGNAHRFRLQFKGSDSHLDEYTQFRTDRVFSAITSEQKQLSYEATNEIIRNNKQDRINAHR